MDMNSLPISGNFVLALIAYALISIFGTGQLIGERLIEKYGWSTQCERALVSELKASRPNPAFAPRIDCNSIFGWFGREGNQLCRKHGNFKLPFADQLSGYQDKLAKANERRFQNAASRTKTRCACAASMTLEDRRMAFGLHAASLRLMTPAPIKNLSSELASALRAPACAMKG